MVAMLLNIAHLFNIANLENSYRCKRCAKCIEEKNWGKEKRREKSKRFLTAGVMVAHNRNPKGNFLSYFCQ